MDAMGSDGMGWDRMTRDGMGWVGDSTVCGGCRLSEYTCHIVCGYLYVANGNNDGGEEGKRGSKGVGMVHCKGGKGGAREQGLGNECEQKQT